MRILIFNWRDLRHSWSGGGEIYIFEQAKRWVKMGHQVNVFCGQDNERKLPYSEVIDGISIIRKGGRYTLYFWAIWYYLRHFRGKFDIIIDVENGIPFFTPLFSTKPKVCYVYHVHATQWLYEFPAPLSYIGFFIERYIFPFLYSQIKIIAISKTTEKELIKIGFKKSNITILYSGINGTTTAKKIIKKFSNPTILYLGRIKKYKRVDLLVKIFPQIVKKIPHARLIIAGWGTEASYVTDLVMKSPLRRKISLVGPVTNSEKRNLLSKSWLFINPSIGEGWSIAVIEANRYGTPAIAFLVSGLSESIQPGKTGLLARDEKDLVEKICLAIKNKKLYTIMSKNAKEWAYKFNWDKTAQQSIRVFKKIAQ